MSPALPMISDYQHAFKAKCAAVMVQDYPDSGLSLRKQSQDPNLNSEVKNRAVRI